MKTILLLAANPKGMETLRLQNEEREIRERLRLAGYGTMPICSSVAARPKEIQQALLDHKPQIVHFCGHGAGADGLAFEDETGEKKLVDGEALAELFGLFSDKIECVVLNACYSEVQAKAIRKHIGYVIGMNKAIGDDAAIRFSVGFYSAVGSGEDYEFSFKLGCNAIRLEGITGEYLTPVLLKKTDHPLSSDNDNTKVTKSEISFEIGKEISAIRNLFENAEYCEAYKKFRELCSSYPSYRDQAISFLTRFNDLNNQIIQGIIPYDQQTIVKQQIASGFLMCLNRFEEEYLTSVLKNRDSDKSSDNHARSGGKKIVVIYKRKAQPDEQVMNLIEEKLGREGYTVMIDRHPKISEEWEDQVTENIKNADDVIILLSSASTYSEMFAHEVEIANKTALENKGKPGLIPVRINLEEPSLPPDLSNILGHLPHQSWRGADDNSNLCRDILVKLKTPPQPISKQCSPLEMVGGAMPLDSKYYIERPVDEEFHSAILRRDSIVLLKGVRQMGKTSFLARGLHAARNSGVQVLLTDFQKLIDSQLQSLESFFFAIGELLADQIGIDACPQDNWRANRSPNTNFERYFRREILAKNPKPLLWAMDEADRLFHCPFGSEIFSMFRTWHNERALNPESLFSRLTIAIAYATESYLFIKDPNQSPFNVGTLLILKDFTWEQVAELNRRYGTPLNEGELKQFYQMLGGQPYLVRRGFNDIASQNMPFDEFAVKADHNDGIFGDHLRRILVLLRKNTKLSESINAVLNGLSCPDYESFYRLRSGGILIGDTKDNVRFRCEIYASYLRKHLS